MRWQAYRNKLHSVCDGRITFKMFPCSSSRRRSEHLPTLHKLFWELIPFLRWLMVLQVLLEGIKIQWITACHVCNSQGRSGFRHVYSELGDRVPVSVSESSWKSDSLCCNARTGNIARFCNRGWLEIIPLYNEAQRPLPPLRARAWRLAPWLQARLRSCRLKAGCASPPRRSTHTVLATPHLPEEIWPESQTSWLLLYESYPPPALARAFVFHLVAVVVFTLHSDGDLKAQALKKLLTGLLGRYCISQCLAASTVSIEPLLFTEALALITSTTRPSHWAVPPGRSTYQGLF